MRALLLLVAFGGWVAFGLGVLRLQTFARGRWEAEPPPAPPRTYRDGIGRFFRRTQQGRGTELSDETRAFAERGGRGAEHDRARRLLVGGAAVFLAAGIAAALVP